jgi:hypothetical protein
MENMTTISINMQKSENLCHLIYKMLYGLQCLEEEFYEMVIELVM